MEQNNDSAQLRHRIQELEKENLQLQISLEAVTEHADLVEAQLLEIQENLESKVQERTSELAEKNAELFASKETAEQARITAEMANRAKSAFLANMSHELRTPLNAVMGYGELLAEELIEENHLDWADDLDKILAAARHLLGLINDILDISKVEAGKMAIHLETFDINSLIRDTISTIQPLVQQKNNHLLLDVTEQLGNVHTDLTKVRQILFNLLGNAAKFTENGQITLIAKHEIKDDKNWIVFSVIDQGIGMTKQQIDSLFQPFMQADSSTTRKFGGTGLGLAISKAFAKMLGGHISVNSELNQGSTFTFYLPCSNSE
jgi:signal transduction histidine kinase